MRLDGHQWRNKENQNIKVVHHPILLHFACLCLQSVKSPLLHRQPSRNRLQRNPRTLPTDVFTEDLGHSAQINSLAFSPDGMMLVSAETYGPIFLWDMARRRRTAILPASARTLSISPNGKQLATGTIHSSMVRIWDLATAKQTGAIIVPSAIEVSAAIFSLDGRKILTLDWKSDDLSRLRPDRLSQFHVRHWDVVTGKQDPMWTITKRLFPLSFVRFGRQPVVTASDVSSDGKTVFAALNSGGIRLYDLESGRERVLGHVEQADCLSLSPDARVLASWTKAANAPVRLWELITGKEIILLTEHQSSPSAIAWSPDGRLVATGDQRDKSEGPIGPLTVRLWDAATGQELAHGRAVSRRTSRP